jgi:hypothetical protein
MQQKPKWFVLSIFFVFTIMTALMWPSPHQFGSPLSLISPSDSLALGRSGPIAPADDSLPETLTPRDNRSLQGSAIFFIGVVEAAGNNKVLMTSPTVVNSLDNGPARVLIIVVAPKDGWYIVNCVTSGSGARASLVASAATPVNVASWDYRNRPPGMHLYPALVELKAGSHYLYWTLEAGAVEFLEAHILKAKIQG